MTSSIWRYARHIPIPHLDTNSASPRFVRLSRKMQSFRKLLESVHSCRKKLRERCDIRNANIKGLICLMPDINGSYSGAQIEKLSKGKRQINEENPDRELYDELVVSNCPTLFHNCSIADGGLKVQLRRGPYLVLHSTTVYQPPPRSVSAMPSAFKGVMVRRKNQTAQITVRACFTLASRSVLVWQRLRGSIIKNDLQHP